MKIKKIIFPFNNNKEFLKKKWWHRLFTVLFLIVLVMTLVTSIFIFSESIGATKFNSTIENNLRSFTQNSDKSLIDTIPDFLVQNTKFGCLKNETINYLSIYEIENKAFCSADISARLDEAAEKIVGDENLTLEQRKEALSESLAKDTEKRYCFIHNDIGCTSSNITAYNHNILYYLQIIAYSLIATYLFSILFQLIYYKGLIYIIYGITLKDDNQ